jgi:hypothetical protein
MMLSLIFSKFDDWQTFIACDRSKLEQKAYQLITDNLGMIESMRQEPMYKVLIDAMSVQNPPIDVLAEVFCELSVLANNPVFIRIANVDSVFDA